MSRKSSTEDYPCSRCEQSFSQEAQLLAHWDKKHGDFCFVCDKALEGHPACWMCGVLAGENHPTQLEHKVKGKGVCENCYNFCVGRPWKEIKLYVHKPRGGNVCRCQDISDDTLDKIPALAK